ncbi:M55 family metallopeptidase [Paenibacillus eucommiae]|uniref:D-amino peptidase n=1 Tax=Paenibacillus eucommiae TaxID=1355755 RepID=A0ABS4IRS2_9BACL|nr:M55 family metallopeptidase [Paenibacillus eucommiae]MBP1990238.1 D-amino peptidase [Paenibacillus eucommiae]
MRFFIITDLEGVSQTDSFSQTRTSDNRFKGPSMKQLAKEVNAAMEGILSVYPDAAIDVFDGHGSGGLFAEDLAYGNYLPPSSGKRCHNLQGYAALLFVGQHAMAGTINAPLCHTFSSRDVMYYRLNDVFIGEFGTHALQAGIYSVPTIFLAGDDKAVLEARMHVPEIETAVTKVGKGLESAVHADPIEVLTVIKERVKRAAQRIHEIPPFTAIQAPYHFEARFYEPINKEWLSQHPEITLVDERTYRIVTVDLFQLPF